MLNLENWEVQLLQYSAKLSTGMEGKIRENRRNKRDNDGGDSCSNDSEDFILVEDKSVETDDRYIIKML